MATRLKVLIVILVIVGSFGLGRYSVHPPDVVTHEITKTDTQTKEKEHVQTHTITTTKKEPTGVVTTVTVTDTSTQEQTATVVDTSTRIDQTVTQAKPTLNLSLITGVSVQGPFIPVYGLSVTKQVLGPFTVGAFGLTNGTVGVSIGMSF